MKTVLVTGCVASFGSQDREVAAVRIEKTEAKKRKSLVVIGSGPVGMVSALMFKDHFDEVVVLERQSKETFLQKHGFTFPIVFTPASIKILERVGAWNQIISEKSEFYGVVIYKRIMGKEFKFTSAQEGVFAHWRNHIIAKLYERMLEEKIQIHFDANVEDIDFQNNLCREARLGDIPFDLLLGADGIYSQTRRLMSKAHPRFSQEEFNLILLDKWYAYRIPAKGALREKFGGGDRFLASHTFLDNLAEYPSEKFRVISTSMRQPDEEINVLIKHEPALDKQRVQELNDLFFGQFVESKQELNVAWEAGISGKFEHVQTPTFYLNSVLLVGDAAHGFESAGDLINIGITSVGSFYEIFNRHSSLQEALQEYDETVGESLRFYADYALRRGREKTFSEVAKFSTVGKLGLVGRHPGIYGIFEDDFEIQKCMRQYKRDLLRIKLFFYGLPLALLFGTSIYLLTKFKRWRST